MDEVMNQLMSPNDKATLLGKWLPREKSKKFGWQAAIFASQYAKLLHPTETINLRRAHGIFRKKLSGLNKSLNTVQINQCANTWAAIDFDKHVSGQTLFLQKKAFTCSGTNSDAPNKIDRVICNTKYRKYMVDCESGEKTIKAATVAPGKLVKELVQNASNETILANNLMWKQQESQAPAVFENTIVLLDTSGSMEWEACPLYDAMAIALQICNQSSIGKRFITFATTPKWVSLEGATDLSDMVNIIMTNSMSAGMSTNIYAAFNLIANACVHKNLSPDEVEKLCLVILSDMQIETADSEWSGNLQENVDSLFHLAGMKSVQGKPYVAPTLIFWNMRMTDGAPTSTTIKNVVMMSGYNVAVLDSIMKNGLSALRNLSPWDNVEVLLSNSRYSWFWSI